MLSFVYAGWVLLRSVRFVNDSERVSIAGGRPSGIYFQFKQE